MIGGAVPIPTLRNGPVIRRARGVSVGILLQMRMMSKKTREYFSKGMNDDVETRDCFMICDTYDEFDQPRPAGPA
ncbi:MAG: hypothetical protein VX218_10590, partial [Pseudomonadota bacterium]|nr:hypothetical protein [Pseudomonadota bacterium]